MSEEIRRVGFIGLGQKDWSASYEITRMNAGLK
jgi:hypothetical protein